MTPGDREHLGDVERERLFSLLSSHAAADHIDLDELERRVVSVTEARTRGEAEAVLSDLPPLPESAARLAARSPGFEDRPAIPGDEPGRPRRGRGHGDSERPADGWRPTDERFRDPRTRRVMRVWEDTAGGRHYVPDDER